MLMSALMKSYINTMFSTRFTVTIRLKKEIKESFHAQG